MLALLAGELAVEDGKLIFYVENQGVCVWAIDPSGEDPAVFVRGDSWADPWIQETETLSEFLIQMLIYEGAMGAPFSARTDGIFPGELATSHATSLPSSFHHGRGARRNSSARTASSASPLPTVTSSR